MQFGKYKGQKSKYVNCLASYVICVMFMVNLQLKRWEASIQDYEILLKETPEDEEVSRALLEAKEQLSKTAR